MSDVLIEGGLLLLPDEETHVKLVPGDLAVRGDAIVSAGDLGDLPADFAPERVDATNHVVMPGLVNAHCHAGMTLLRGYADDLPLMQWLQDKVWPAEAHLGPDDIYWGTALAVAEMLTGGITSYADMYFYVDEMVAASVDLGIRTSVSLGLISSSPGAEDDLLLSRELVERLHGEHGDLVRVQLGPHAPYTCDPPYLERVRDLAAELECGIHIHLAETRDEIEQMKNRYGVSPVQYLSDLGIMECAPFIAAHCVHLADDDLCLMSEAGVGVVHCAVSNHKLGSGIAPLVRLVGSGLPVGFGTDGACSTGRLDIWSEMRAAALVQKGILGDPEVLPAGLMLHMATRGGALAMGRDDVGQLLPGMKADVITIDIGSFHMTPGHNVLSLLAYSAGREDVRDVFVNGQRVVDGGTLCAADHDTITAKASGCAASLVEKV